ncbi:hypothetical protein MRX96_031434 [Rhipicephalus microplus]
MRATKASFLLPFVHPPFRWWRRAKSSLPGIIRECLRLLSQPFEERRASHFASLPLADAMKRRSSASLVASIPVLTGAAEVSTTGHRVRMEEPPEGPSSLRPIPLPPMFTGSVASPPSISPFSCFDDSLASFVFSSCR